MFVVDVEADGPCPGLYSMVSFAVVPVSKALAEESFYAAVAPTAERYRPELLALLHTTREAHLQAEPPEVVMPRFARWLEQVCAGRRPVFVSDNPAFDWQFLNYYLIAFCGQNPFGHTARRIGDLAAGLERKLYATSLWKSKRRTRHTHHPLDDARGNVEALHALLEKHGLPLPD